MRILLTGAAGFIGAAVARRLLARGDEVIGVDNLNAYYDPALKRARLAGLQGHPRFRLAVCGVEDRPRMAELFAEADAQRVVHLAAQAGVRYSLEAPAAYIDANLVGFGNVLEGCRRHAVEHLVFASSSSVYGQSLRSPYSTHDGADHPLSLYGATKRANELMAHSYAHLYTLPVTGLRFFTVYGPWGRPDMAPWRFAERMLAGAPVEIYNHGHHERDFTYIDDVVEALLRLLDQPARPDPGWHGAAPDPAASSAPYRLYNIGGQRPVALLRFVELMEQALGVRADKHFLPAQPGDVVATCADVADLVEAVAYRPEVTIEDGVARFVDWFRAYQRLPGAAAPRSMARTAAG